jgi:hypothetical protein
MITWRKYVSGDLARVNSYEPEPYEGWAGQVEQEGRGLTTILREGVPIVVIGLLDAEPGIAWCFAAVDRDLSAGHGKLITKMIRARLLQGLAILNIHTVRATAKTEDRTAHVFLRAVGLRAVGPAEGGMINYQIHEERT